MTTRGHEMTVFERAQRVYDEEPCARPFFDDLAYHFQYGYVFNTPELFLMGRPIDVHAPRDVILSPWCTFDQPNGWLIWLGVGDLEQFFKFVPYPLEFVAWERENVLRVYAFEKVKHICGLIKKTHWKADYWKRALELRLE